jgi:hypothetical protein
MPAEYDPTYATMAAGMGMTVSQALTRKRADDNADATAGYRAQVQADRDRRTGIYETRSAAATAQGDRRLQQADRRIGISQAKGGSKPKPKVSASNNDLSYLLN